MKEILINLTGWFPAIILPAATLSQVIKLAQTKDADGISIITWVLFGMANIGLYIFTEKYFSLQSLIGLLGTAILDFVIVGQLIYYKRHRLSK